MIQIRKASERDASVASEILCASIRDLCAEYHNNDPELVSRWIANKTPGHLANWIANPQLALFIAELDRRPAGIGCLSLDGEILLNYVAPAHRFCGISRAVLSHLEGYLAQAGFSRGRLTSTKTAHRFYRRAAWLDFGEPEEMFGLVGYPMQKDM